MGRLKQLIGLEARDSYTAEGELIVAVCPNGDELTEGDIIRGEPGSCPECGIDLMAPDEREEGD
jgi:hypothetical protein